MPAIKPARYSFCSGVNAPGGSAGLDCIMFLTYDGLKVFLEAHGAIFEFWLARDWIGFAGHQDVHTAGFVIGLSPMERHKERSALNRAIHFYFCPRRPSPRHNPHRVALSQSKTLSIFGVDGNKGRGMNFVQLGDVRRLGASVPMVGEPSGR